MTNKLLANINPDDLPAIPPQVRKIYHSLTPDQELELRMIAYKTTDFFKWIEAKHAGKLHELFDQGVDWLDNINKAIEKHDKEKPDELDEDAMKKWAKEETRLKRMHSSISEQWLAFSKELRVVTQNHLNREAPKKLEVTQVKVTPGDVANLIDNARKVVDIGKKE